MALIRLEVLDLIIESFERQGLPTDPTMSAATGQGGGIRESLNSVSKLLIVCSSLLLCFFREGLDL